MYIFLWKVVFQVLLLNNWQRPSIASIDFSLRERQTGGESLSIRQPTAQRAHCPMTFGITKEIASDWGVERCIVRHLVRERDQSLQTATQDGRTKKSAPWTTRHIYTRFFPVSLLYTRVSLSFPSTLGRLMNEPSFFDATPQPEKIDKCVHHTVSRSFAQTLLKPGLIRSSLCWIEEKQKSYITIK
jgi:hypothetical protein